MLLTQSNIASIDLLPGQSERVVFDERLPGFGVRLRCGGRRTWIVQYRFRGKQRRRTIGPVELMLAGQAYAAAQIDLAAVAHGQDPQQGRQGEQPHTTTFPVFERFLESKRPNLVSSTYAQLRLHLTEHWRSLHDLSLRGIDKGDVTRGIERIVAERGRYAANRARASLSSFFKWALRGGLVDVNPVVETTPAPEEVRLRVLSDFEIVTIWKSCGDDAYGSIVRLLILTGQSREDMGSMFADEINLQDRKWRVGGHENRTEECREVPLCDVALDIINKTLERRGRTHGSLFGRTALSGFSGWSKAKHTLERRIASITGSEPYWEAIDAINPASDEPVEMKLVKPYSWRLCDIRHTVDVRLSELGIAPHVIDAILNRAYRGKRPSMKRYHYLDETRHALDLWENHLSSLRARDETCAKS
jgi:site-specific recombinase XerC